MATPHLDTRYRRKSADVHPDNYILKRSACCLLYVQAIEESARALNEMNVYERGERVSAMRTHRNEVEWNRTNSQQT